MNVPWMNSRALASSSLSTFRLSLIRSRGLLVALAVFIVLFLTVQIVSPAHFDYFEFSSLSAGGATLALAAIGETAVVLTGGFDLSAGAVISLVNVVLGVGMGSDIGSQICFGCIALAVGAAVGAVNGLLVSYGRLQPIVVTLSTMFIIQGITLLIMDKPGGAIGPAFAGFFMGDIVPGLLPGPVVVVAVAALFWYLIRSSRLGVGMYAVGSDEDAAYASGVPTRAVKLWSYVIAGIFYGAAGAFISAQTGSADPLVGRPMLLQIFAAVALGGTVLGGGRGGALGSIVGAYTLMIVVNILLVLNVSAYYSSVAEGVILLLAVLAGSLSPQGTLANYLHLGRVNLRAKLQQTDPAHLKQAPFNPELPTGMPGKAATTVQPDWLASHRDVLRLIVPSYVGLAVMLVITQFVDGNTLTSFGYFNSLIVLSSFLIILALGQGTVILTGGLDLSIPWTIGLVGIIVAGIVRGADSLALWAVPVGLMLGSMIGALNGFGIVVFGMPPIVVTLAMNGILQGIALVYSNGTPDGFASPSLRWLMTGHLLGTTPVVWIVIGFVIAAVLLLNSTVFGRRIYAVGNSSLVARLSGVNVGATLIAAYSLSGLCAAMVGILLVGFSGQASLGMGDEYLLPSIAVVVVGGTLITGGRGHYLGMVGGVLLLTTLSTLLAGSTLPHAVRDIILGFVVVAAVLALRERST
jgi:ribose transport system permease protein